MRDFSFCYDTYLNLEEPNVYLANPNKVFLSDGAIYTLDLSTELYFNNISSITFTCHYMRNGIVNVNYDNIIEGNLLLVQNIGWFQITEPNEKGTGVNKFKTVKALSLENEFCHKYVTSFGSMGVEDNWDGGLDVYWLWNETMKNQSILHIVMDKMPAWKVGYIDPTITTETRSFNVDRADIYTFLTSNVSEAYNCIFIFDTFDMSVNAYNLENIGHLTDLYFSHHNLVKELKKDVNLSNIKTVLYVQGGEYGTTTLDISEINPTGGNYIIDCRYFKNRMSKELQNKLDAYNIEYDNRQKLYQQYLVTNEDSLGNLYTKLADLENRVPITKVSDFNNQLIELEEKINNETNIAIKTQLKQEYYSILEEKLKLLEQQEDYINSEWSLYGSIELETMFKAYSGVLALFAGKTDTISLEMYNETYEILYGTNGIVAHQKIRDEEILACENKIIEVKKRLKETVIDIREFLGETLYAELSHYLLEDTFTDTNFIATSIMTDSERLKMEQELYQEALKQLAKVSKPNPTFTLDSMDFAAIKEFIPLTENMKLGDFATVELRENTEDYPSDTVQVRLLKIAINWSKNDFSLTFSSTDSLKDGELLFTEIKDQAQSSSNTLSLNGSGWNYASNQSSFVKDYMTNPLDLALQSLHSSKNIGVTIDGSGIHCKEYNSNTGTYSDEQLWITKNLICFSNDAFKTVCTALGKVNVNGKELYGLVAQYLYGSLIAGQNLIISNDKGTFTVNGDGVSISQLDLEIENDYYKIQLGNMNNSEDDDIFTIWKKINGNWIKQLYFNNGDLTITGEFYSLAGSNFGNWVVGEHSIYYKINEFGNANGMYFGVDGFSIGNKFKVDANGKLTATSGTFSGSISGSSVTTTTTITGGTIIGSSISGGNITGGTISGGSINGASITASNSYFTNATLNSCYVSGDLVADDASITVTSSLTGNQMKFYEGKLRTNGAIGIYNNDIQCRMIYINNTNTGTDRDGGADNGQSITSYIKEIVDERIAELGL